MQQHKRQGCKMQIVCAKMTSLDVIFWRGNKSSSRSPARICRGKHKKSTAQALLSWTIWAWLVGKSKPLTVQGQLQRQSSFANANITGYVYRQSQFFFSFLILSFKMASACPMLEWWEDFHVKLLVFCWLNIKSKNFVMADQLFLLFDDVSISLSAVLQHPCCCIFGSCEKWDCKQGSMAGHGSLSIWPGMFLKFPMLLEIFFLNGRLPRFWISYSQQTGLL